MNKKQIMTLDDILDAVMLEESEPTHEALAKWCALFPAHRDELVEFFATWAVQKESKEQVVVDADRVGSRMVSQSFRARVDWIPGRRLIPGPIPKGSGKG